MSFLTNAKTIVLSLAFITSGCGDVQVENLRTDTDKVEEQDELDLSKRTNRIRRARILKKRAIVRKAKQNRLKKLKKQKQSPKQIVDNRCRFSCNTTINNQDIAVHQEKPSFQPSLISLPGGAFSHPVQIRKNGEGCINFSLDYPRAFTIGECDQRFSELSVFGGSDWDLKYSEFSLTGKINAYSKLKSGNDQYGELKGHDSALGQVTYASLNFMEVEPGVVQIKDTNTDFCVKAIESSLVWDNCSSLDKGIAENQKFILEVK